MAYNFEKKSNCRFLKRTIICDEEEYYITINDGVLEYINLECSEFRIKEFNSEIHMDIVVEIKNGFNIIGSIKDKNLQPVKGMLVTILGETYIRGVKEFVAISNMISDDDGEYQFFLENAVQDFNYKISIKKINNKLNYNDENK